MTKTTHGAPCSFTSIKSCGDNSLQVNIWWANVLLKVNTYAWKSATNSPATEENKLRRNFWVNRMCNFSTWRWEMWLMPYTCAYAFIPSDLQLHCPLLFQLVMLNISNVWLIPCSLLIGWRCDQGQEQ